MKVLSKDHPFHRHEMVDLGSITLASFRRRANALVLDAALVFTPYVLVMAIEVYEDSAGRGIPAWLPSVTAAKWETVALFLAYMTLCTHLTGGETLGKRWQKIRVVPLFKARLGLWQCFERTLGYSASSLEFGFGFVQYFIHPNRQTVHDRIAETVVVNSITA